MQIDNYEYKISAAGRVNIIGEHIDYCGGKVCPAALSVKNTVYIKKNNTNKINIKWTTLDITVSLDINNLLEGKNLKYGNYQAGALYYLKEAGYELVGCDMLQDCTVPFGSGLSSSAAIEVSTIASMLKITNQKIDPVEIALIAQRAEREFTGVNCGIMDQYASACGKDGHVMILDCKTLECKYVPIDLGDYVLAIINSKKPHKLGESKYNERRLETEKSLEILKEHLDIECLADCSVDDFNKYSYLFDEILYKRCKHVVYECQRVNDAIKAMETKDVLLLGKLLNESHNSLSELYEVTGIELDTLASLAQNHYACIGARMVGGGFGGCVVSIVLKSELDNFKRDVLKEYKKMIGYDAECYDASISDGIIIAEL